MSKSIDLKNCDELTVEIDETYCEQQNIKLKGNTQTITVSGLPEGKEIDIFEDVEISYEGVAPDAWISTIQNTSSDDFLKTVYYSADKASGLNIGDEVTVTAYFNESDAESHA